MDFTSQLSLERGDALSAAGDGRGRSRHCNQADSGASTSKRITCCEINTSAAAPDEVIVMYSFNRRFSRTGGFRASVDRPPGGALDAFQG